MIIPKHNTVITIKNTHKQLPLPGFLAPNSKLMCS